MTSARHFIFLMMICLLVATAGFIFYAPIISDRVDTSTASRVFADNTKKMANSARDLTESTTFGVSMILDKLLRPPLKWGAYAGDEIYSAPQFEALVGRKMDLQPIFVGWYVAFPLDYATTVRDEGKTLVIFWEQYDVTLDEIINGSTDRYIDEFAQAAAAYYRGPIILVPLHEMNGDWAPWSGAVPGNSPAKVIAAWRHIHDRFAGIPNVKFAWNVNNGSHPDTAENAIANYYPGDAYVDYVSVDGFNDGNPWQSWSAVFDDALSQLKAYHKPIYILSMASAPGSEKAAWITDALTVQIPRYSEIEGWIWFHSNKEANWLVNSDERALEAFKGALPKK